MSSRRRRYSKRELLGSLHVDYIMSVTDLGLVHGTNRWDVLRAFLNRGEARAERLVEDKDGFLILQKHPGPPEYRRNLRLPGKPRCVLLAHFRRAGGRPERRGFSERVAGPQAGPFCG